MENLTTFSVSLDTELQSIGTLRQIRQGRNDFTLQIRLLRDATPLELTDAVISLTVVQKTPLGGVIRTVTGESQLVTLPGETGFITIPGHLMLTDFSGPCELIVTIVSGDHVFYTTPLAYEVLYNPAYRAIHALYKPSEPARLTTAVSSQRGTSSDGPASEIFLVSEEVREELKDIRAAMKDLEERAQKLEIISVLQAERVLEL